MNLEFAIYLDYVILGQLIPAKNNPGNIDEYEYKKNEMKLNVPFTIFPPADFWG